MKKIASFLFSNTTTRQTVIKNTFWYTANQIISRFIRVIVVIYAARILGVTAWGSFSYVLGLAGFLMLMSDIGLSGLIVREANRDQSVREKITSTIFFLKLVLLFLSVILFLVFAPFLSIHKEMLLLFPLLAVSTALDSIREFTYSLAKSLEKFELEALLQFFSNILLLISVFLFLSSTSSTYSLTFAFLMASAASLALSFLVFTNFFTSLWKHIEFSRIKSLFIAALPFSIPPFLTIILMNTDTILLGFFSSIFEVGIYSAAQRPLQSLYLVPGFFAGPLFPLMSRLIHTNSPSFRDIFNTSLLFATITAIPITVISVIFGKEIISLLYGEEYASASPVFQILAVSLLAYFPFLMTMNVIFSLKENRILFGYSILAVVGNTLLDLTFISFGAIGIALSTTLVTFLVSVYSFYRLRDSLRLSGGFPNISRQLAAGFLMALCALLLSLSSVSIFISIPLAAVIYLGALLLFKDPGIYKLYSTFLAR